MIDPRRVFVTEIALSMLKQWYSTWDDFKNHRNGEIRRMALYSKASGLVHHDRALAKAETVLGERL